MAELRPTAMGKKRKKSVFMKFSQHITDIVHGHLSDSETGPIMKECTEQVTNQCRVGVRFDHLAHTGSVDRKEWRTYLHKEVFTRSADQVVRKIIEKYF